MSLEDGMSDNDAESIATPTGWRRSFMRSITAISACNDSTGGG